MTNASAKSLPRYMQDQRERAEQARAEQMAKKEKKRFRELDYTLYKLEDKSPRAFSDGLRRTMSLLTN